MTATVVVRLVLVQLVIAGGRRLVAGRGDLRTDAVVVAYGGDVVHLGLVLKVEDGRVQVAVRLCVHETLVRVGLLAGGVLRYFDFGLQPNLRRIRHRRRGGRDGRIGHHGGEWMRWLVCGGVEIGAPVVGLKVAC